jgi:DNA polymerase III sliding clamp (beta) subunit (PCNA family)
MLTLSTPQTTKLLKLIKKLRFIEAGSYRNVIRFKVEDSQLTIEYTDGFTLNRLKLGAVTNEAGVAVADKVFTIKIDRKEQLALLANALSCVQNATFKLDKDELRVTVGDEVVSTSYRQYDSFPDFDRVIPSSKRKNTVITINPALLMDIAKRIDLGRNKGLTLQIDRDNELSPIIVTAHGNDDSFNLLMPIRR